ncbi:DUF397 domain-containing protein [Sphaerisporangium sp. NPDC051011]|uniref:DUF397 domain-containing protein n=1 Tax=Sphaerisporangium sp. NPDC051011 TaxID=3155792 RepID=UPI0033CACE07
MIGTRRCELPERDLPAVVWRKSTRSQQNGACVEAAFCDTRVAIRDSKDPDGPKIMFAKSRWNAFIRGLKDGTMQIRS